MADAVDFYVSEGGAEAARELVLEVRRLAGVLTAWPRLGRDVGQGVLIISARRFPYDLVYRADRDEVVILALAHHSRSPGFWRSRL